jgi:hypothetical protein
LNIFREKIKVKDSKKEQLANSVPLKVKNVENIPNGKHFFKKKLFEWLRLDHFINNK